MSLLKFWKNLTFQINDKVKYNYCTFAKLKKYMRHIFDFITKQLFYMYKTRLIINKASKKAIPNDS